MPAPATLPERPLYARTAYAEAFGFQVVDVEEWRTAVLIRQIPESKWHDAFGCYPLALIDVGADLLEGLDRLRRAGLVSVALVPDPLSGPSLDRLQKAFSICRPFKAHYVIDHELAPTALPATHLRWIRKALRLCAIGPVRLHDTLSEWARLYSQIVNRHQVAELQRFTPSYFAALASMAEVEAFAARVDDRIVAMALWVRSGDIVYYHLGASSQEGYRAQAMYGIFAEAGEYFSDCRVIHLGGIAGVSSNGQSGGLARFKSGFANREVAAYFCGSCLDPERYQLLAAEHATSFFPAYRAP